jgi:sterol desaturase/sphingolipid hydroxylase (fatty acid hydroxylase superfamily)
MVPAILMGVGRSMFGAKAWRGRSYDLGRMGLRELVVAFATYYAIQAYAMLALVGGGLAIAWTEPGRWWAVAFAAVAAVIVYPAVWYALHRFVLHGRFLYRSPLTAALWKRIHFDHHQDPHRLEVLFGALVTTLPTIVLVTGPIGWAIAGRAGAAAAIAAALVTTCFYEFCHCVQHLNYKPRSAWLARIKQLHLAHHFHDERGNFGITSFACDRLLGTYYASVKERPHSATVFNLGYDEAEAARFPWVARLTGAPPMARPPRYDRMVESGS